MSSRPYALALIPITVAASATLHAHRATTDKE